MSNYAVEKTRIDGFEVVELYDSDNRIAIAVDIGNTLYNWIWKGQSVIWFPYSLAAYADNDRLAGNPFLYPWANRLQEDAIPVDGRMYDFDHADIYRDSNGLPLHGLLLKSARWETVKLEVSAIDARHVAELNFPETVNGVNVFPFKHRLRMEHLLNETGLWISVTVVNDDSKPLPLSFGFHPYFSFGDTDRSRVRLSLPFTEHYITDQRLLPDGRLEPVTDLFTGRSFLLDNTFLDDGFTDVEGDPVMKVEMDQWRAKVNLGDDYPVGMVYAPVSKESAYICLEPMLQPTNALHLAHQKKIAPLQYVASGEQKTVTFGISLESV